MRISDWSSDVCSSDLALDVHRGDLLGRLDVVACREALQVERGRNRVDIALLFQRGRRGAVQRGDEHVAARDRLRSEEHTSELQSLMRISYAVFCLKKKKTKKIQT